jgi:signal transduction histidine kinase
MQHLDPVTTATPDTAKPAILIVDDELGPRESLKFILTPTYQVIVARDGLEGLEKFEACTPDLVISDIRMPRLDGIQFLKRIRERNHDIPFILITGCGTVESAQQAVRGGAFDYISKPYNIREIHEVVRRALEAAREKRETHSLMDELRQVNTRMEEQLADMEKKATVGELSAEMIHDLNNPLCVLQGYLELLKGSIHSKRHLPLDEEREFLDVIREQFDRCIRLTRSFLNFARQPGLQWERTNVNDLLRDTLNLLNARLKEKRLKLELELAPELPVVWTPRSSLQQVVFNLALNAVQAMESKGSSLTIRTRLVPAPQPGAPPEIELSVIDDGPGVPAAIRERIFEPFFSTKDKDKGTGLGLAICRRVATSLDGELTLVSQEGEGTAFHLRFPQRETPPTNAG